MTVLGDQIKEKLLEGSKYGEITHELNVATSTVAYHARQLGMTKFTYKKRIYDWQQIQRRYDEGFTLNEIKLEFGMNHTTLREAINRGALLTLSNKDLVRKNSLRRNRKATGRSKHLSAEQVLVEQSRSSMTVVKAIIKEQQLLPYSCSKEECHLFGIDNPIWCHGLLTLHLDHINGIRNDHRLGNLRWLCPNCHSQTSTYCGRNKRVMAIPEGIEPPFTGLEPVS